MAFESEDKSGILGKLSAKFSPLFKGEELLKIDNDNFIDLSIKKSTYPFSTRKKIVTKMGYFIELNETKEVATDELGNPLHFSSRQEAEDYVRLKEINGIVK
jgi:hypothetical protein